jgi:FMN phosphatase YigB (HAD superfamily)
LLTTILFDFFGTLVEYEHHPNGGVAVVSDELEAEARRTLAEYPFDAYASAFLVANDLPDSLAGQFQDVYIPEWNGGVRHSEAVLAAIRRLSQGFALGVVTNTHLHWLVPSHLERMGIAPHFRHVVTSIGHGKRKPNAEIFRHALALHGCDPKQALFVGDSLEADYLAARAVGIPALLIDPLGMSGLPPDCRIRSVADLPGLLVGR